MQLASPDWLAIWPGLGLAAARGAMCPTLTLALTLTLTDPRRGAAGLAPG